MHLGAYGAVSVNTLSPWAILFELFSVIAGEFTSKDFTDFVNFIGARQLFTAGHAPGSNGKVKRANRTIVELATSLLISASMPKGFWAEASATVVYVLNRMRNVTGANMSPEKLWTSLKRAWGSFAMVHIENPSLRHKFNRKAVPGRFIGYAEGTRAYRIALLPHMTQVVESRNVMFDEASVLPAGKYYPNHYGTAQAVDTAQAAEEEDERILIPDGGSLSNTNHHVTEKTPYDETDY